MIAVVSESCLRGAGSKLQVLALRPRFAAAAARRAAEAAGQDYEASEFDDDEDAAKGMARLFVEVGECYAALIASGAEYIWHQIHVQSPKGSQIPLRR